MAKTITSFNIDLSDMAAAGGSRSFEVMGDTNAIFSLEVKNEDGHYYNFTTTTFAAAKSRLKQKALGGNGRYTGSIMFPSITDNDQYDIYLFAESAHDTIHATHKEVRFGDGSLDINSSTGSNSNLLQKVIYQYTDTTITIDPRYEVLSGYAPSWFSSRVTDTVVVGRGKNSGKQSFTLTVQSSATTAMQILRQPIETDFIKEIILDTASDEIIIQGEDIWSEAKSRASGVVDGQTRGSNTINGDFTGGGTKIIVDALPSGTCIGDRVTGYTVSSVVNSLLGTASAADVSVTRITALNPDGDNANEFTVDPEIVIADGATLYFNAPYYRRFKTTNSGNKGVLGLVNGMKEAAGVKELYPTTLAAAGGNRPGTLGPYEDSTTYTTEVVNLDGSISEQTNKNINISYPAIDTTSFKPVITNGKVTYQDGFITFTEPIKGDLRQDNTDGADGGGRRESKSWFTAKGTDWIKSLHNTEVKFSNLKVVLTAPTTTTTSGVSASATIPVADREGTIANVSTISGIGIAAGVANPTITSSTADGAGSWTASAVQTLENGITLTVNGTSRNATITGDIEVTDCGDSSFTIILDITSFLTGA